MHGRSKFNVYLDQLVHTLFSVVFLQETSNYVTLLIYPEDLNWGTNRVMESVNYDYMVNTNTM